MLHDCYNNMRKSMEKVKPSSGTWTVCAQDKKALGELEQSRGTKTKTESNVLEIVYFKQYKPSMNHIPKGVSGSSGERNLGRPLAAR